MATQSAETQSQAETKVYVLDYTPALLDGVSITAVALSYSGDNADGNEPVMFSILNGNVAFVSIGNLELGHHVISCLADTDDVAIKPEIQLLIDVKY